MKLGQHRPVKAILVCMLYYLLGIWFSDIPFFLLCTNKLLVVLTAVVHLAQLQHGFLKNMSGNLTKNSTLPRINLTAN